MSNELMIFEGQEVMILAKDELNIDFKGDFLIRAKDVANILDYDQTKGFTSIIKEKYIVKVKNSDFLKWENRKLNNAGETFITSLGLNQGLANSTMPKAEPFQDWLYEEVLPSIQKTGQYSMIVKKDSYVIEDPIERAKRWIEEQQEKQLLLQENEVLKPKAEIHDKIVDATNLVGINKIAKNIGVGERKMFEFLRSVGVFYKEGKDNLPKQAYQNAGYFEVKLRTTEDSFGNTYTNYTTKVTGKGEIYILKLIEDYGGAKLINNLKLTEIRPYVEKTKIESKLIHIN